MKVSVPALRYWTRRRFNNTVKPKPLPFGFEENIDVSIPKKQESKQTPDSILAADISNTDGLSLIVPQRLSKPHKLISRSGFAFFG